MACIRISFSAIYIIFLVFAKGAGEEFFKEAKDMYDKLSGSTAIRMARRAAQSITSVWDTNEIKRLSDIIEIQLAQTVMQRWIMANPMLREKYHRQKWMDILIVILIMHLMT